MCDTPSVKEQTQCRTPGAGKASWERGECPKVLLGSVIDFITGVRAIDSWRRTTGVEDNGDEVHYAILRCSLDADIITNSQK